MYYITENSSPTCTVYRKLNGEIVKIVLHKDAVKYLPILSGEINSSIKLE